MYSVGLCETFEHHILTHLFLCRMWTLYFLLISLSCKGWKKIQAIDIGLAALDIVTTGKGQLANLNLGAGSGQPPATIWCTSLRRLHTEFYPPIIDLFTNLCICLLRRARSIEWIEQRVKRYFHVDLHLDFQPTLNFLRSFSNISWWLLKSTSANQKAQWNSLYICANFK